MANSLWTYAVRTGTAAGKPTTPDVPATTFVFYYETDTAKLKMWNGSAWVEAAGLGSAVAPSYTFATLPASPVTGQLAYVTDSSVAAAGDTEAGSGNGESLDRFDGSNWIGIAVVTAAT
jgi:hypothetical protein